MRLRLGKGDRMVHRKNLMGNTTRPSLSGGTRLSVYAGSKLRRVNHIAGSDLRDIERLLGI